MDDQHDPGPVRGGSVWGEPVGPPADGVPDPFDPGGEPDGEASSTAGAEPPRPPGWAKSLREWVVVIGVALIVALLVRNFVAAPFSIPSGSMNDTLSKGDRILVNKLSYRLHDVNHRDVVVFDKPPDVDFGDPRIKHLIKRVIGIPGDQVEIRDCQVYVNGVVQVEEYILGSCTDSGGGAGDPDGDGVIEVPEGFYFVMGDNRQPGQSQDSRFWGFLDGDLIVGRAFVVVHPFSHWRWL